MNKAVVCMILHTLLHHCRTWKKQIQRKQRKKPQSSVISTFVSEVRIKDAYAMKFTFFGAEEKVFGANSPCINCV